MTMVTLDAGLVMWNVTVLIGIVIADICECCAVIAHTPENPDEILGVLFPVHKRTVCVHYSLWILIDTAYVIVFDIFHKLSKAFAVGAQLLR
jgi:hypothetical protein